jgi:hypothetical protein
MAETTESSSVLSVLGEDMSWLAAFTIMYLNNILKDKACLSLLSGLTTDVLKGVL